MIPLKWITLFTVLQTITLLAFYTNFMANDFVWCSIAILAYFLIVMPIYLNSAKNDASNSRANTMISHQKLTFSNLFRMCTRAVFSDYRISLLSKIPLALQALAGGSLLYEVFGADWILHALGGFGVGALALKAYMTGVGYYGYNRLASYFGLSRFRSFEAERKNASAEWTLFSIIVIALVWEVLERSIHFVSPANVLRIGIEPVWNISGDMFSGIFGAMIAWYLLTHKLKWL